MSEFDKDQSSKYNAINFLPTLQLEQFLDTTQIPGITPQIR